MKGLLTIAGLAVLALAGYMMFKPKATNRPNVKTPDVDVNGVAHGAKNAGDAAATEVSSWDHTTWQIVSVLFIVGVMYVLVKKYPALKWVVVGVFLTILGFMVTIWN